jgi:hypothetical protein
MNNLTRIILLGIVLLSASSAAQAFTTVDLDGTNATGINDLDIGGTAYDVVFEFTAINTSDLPPVGCGSSVPCDAFFGNESGAAAAVTAINLALNSTAAETLGSQQPPKFSYFVPYSVSSQGVEARQGTYSGIWLPVGASLDADEVVEMARFSPAVVPIPPAAWLFGSALAILGWVRRRVSSSAA